MASGLNGRPDGFLRSSAWLTRCKFLAMVATCISNIVSWEESIAALGPAKGNALPLVGGIKVGYCSERQTRGPLVAKMWWILDYTASLPGLTTMNCPSMSSQPKPQLGKPS
ncbi:uncharacterized protein LOC127752511 [Oryza glaberrima]|nr:uncharacterized protein LOC127752511 [Oryza glaberrima]